MKLTDLQLDALREISNIGTGNAATSLSLMLEKRIQVHIPTAQFLAVAEVAKTIGGAEQKVSAIYFQILGQAPGSFLLIFSMAEAERLVFQLLGQASKKILRGDELAESSLKELGNIFTGTYFNALSQLMPLRFSYSVPQMAIDMLQAVLDAILIERASKAEGVLVLETVFTIDKDTIRGHALFLPDPQSLTMLLSALPLKIQRKKMEI